ncbi:hypothetical protein J6590_015210 [Homalodisca vitripennis]|nr:hypothetical protein J6590_015210 [Homalodisca vitripennis]
MAMSIRKNREIQGEITQCLAHSFGILLRLINRDILVVVLIAANRHPILRCRTPTSTRETIAASTVSVSKFDQPRAFL